MKTLGVVGPDAADLIDRLAPQLDGRVATVESREATAIARDDDGTASSVGLADDGTWVGSGGGLALDELLDDLAPSHDYALLAGFPEADVPTLALGDSTARRVVHSEPDAQSADPETIREVLDAEEPRVTLSSLIERIKRSPDADRAGAIATFTGRVRAKDGDDDERTTHLEFEKYEGVADERMESIARELTARDGVWEVLMHHRTGRIEDGEDIVFVVVLAGHRDEAFRAVEDGINRLKDEVPIFKKETTIESEFWVHDRP